VRIIDVDNNNEGYFMNCVLDTELKNYNSEQVIRKTYIDKHKQKGQGAKLMMDDGGTIVGRLHYVPIEFSPLVGENLLVILCLYVHMYKHNIGDKRNKGYGSLFLDYIEKEARKNNFNGIAVWAMDWDWNPVSFYLHRGYIEADRIDKVVVAWKPFNNKAVKPKLARIPEEYFNRKSEYKVSLVLADNDWCNCRNRMNTAFEAIRGIEDRVEVHIVTENEPGGYVHLGYAGGIFIDGEPYHPYRHLGSSSDLREYIISKHAEKQNN